MNAPLSTNPDARPTEPVMDLNIDPCFAKLEDMVTELVKVLKREVFSAKLVTIVNDPVRVRKIEPPHAT